MYSAVLVALVASATSLLIAVSSAWVQQRGASQARRETRRSDAKVVLDRYRGPLLMAAWELGDRIDNIRHRDLLLFPGGESATKLTTLFRVAQYFGWRETLRKEVQLLRFESEDSTKLISGLLTDITRAFATDKVDGVRGMLWTEEQRAIGELMIIDGGERAEANCLGYAAFVGQYSETFSPWLDGLARDVLTCDDLPNDRLRLLQWALYGLVVRLDEENVYAPDRHWLKTTRTEVNGSGTLTRDSGEDGGPLEQSIREHLAAL
jgi:hypothetical protein